MRASARGGVVEDVLAVVEQEQHPQTTGEGLQGAGGRAGRRYGQAEHRGDRRQHLVAALRRGQVDGPHPVREAVGGDARGLDGEPGLAAPGRPDDRHQRLAGQQLADPVALGVAPDQPRAPDRQVDLDAALRCGRPAIARAGRAASTAQRRVVGQDPAVQ